MARPSACAVAHNSTKPGIVLRIPTSGQDELVYSAATMDTDFKRKPATPLPQFSVYGELSLKTGDLGDLRRYFGDGFFRPRPECFEQVTKSPLPAVFFTIARRPFSSG